MFCCAFVSKYAAKIIMLEVIPFCHQCSHEDGGFALTLIRYGARVFVPRSSELHFAPEVARQGTGEEIAGSNGMMTMQDDDDDEDARG